MKALALVALLMLMVSSINAAQTKPSRVSKTRPAGKPTTINSEQSLKAAEEQLAGAFKNRDREALGKMLDEQFIFTDDNGQAINKAQYIDAVLKIIQVDSFTLDEMTVRVFGDTGVVAGRWSGKLTVQGKTSDSAVRYTDTFVKRLGQWRVVASQITRIRGQEVTTASGLKYTNPSRNAAPAPTFAGSMANQLPTGSPNRAVSAPPIVESTCSMLNRPTFRW